MGSIEFETFPLQFGKPANPEVVRRISVAAELHGFDAVQFPDHVTLPQDIPNEYPFNDSGVYSWDETTPIYDVFQILSFVAGVTTEIRVEVGHRRRAISLSGSDGQECTVHRLTLEWPI